MELMNQPFNGQLGNRLIELLASEDYHTLNIVVAFAKNSGVLRIKGSLENFRARGRTVNVYVGVDLGGTSYEALTALLLHTDSLHVLHSEKGQTFHPKIYHFLGDKKGLIVVGSHNLTGGGLWTNFESSVIITFDSSSSNEMKMQSGLGAYLGDLASLKASCMSINAQCDIDKLLEHGYVFKEISEQVRLAKVNKNDETRARLFGNGVSATLPRIGMPKKQKMAAASVVPTSSISVPLSDEGETIWFETRRMTGGSRNILDLSKKSLVARGDPSGTPFDLGDLRFMRGGVSFFGLDPADTGHSRRITLNFEGIDYESNTILFPTGENANGTWRLQIKGVDSAERKITEAFRATGEENYLVKKIITFTKIQDNYYFMSVFPDAEIENFKDASRILAHNGMTNSAKWLGLI